MQSSSWYALRALIAASVATTLVVDARRACAADGAPAGLMTSTEASGGATDVATTGFEAGAKDDAEAKDASEAKISAGGLFVQGNSRSTAMTGAGHLRLRRRANQLTTDAAANYARAAADPDAAQETTVENYQGKVRYDRFVSGSFAVFGSVSARRDRFQGLDLRLNIDPGVSYYFVDQPKQQFWSEVGYDLQYDIRRDEAIAGTTLGKTETRHNGRLFVGYGNTINEAVSFNTGLEYLQNASESRVWRLGWDASLSSKIGGNFSIATTLSLRYDHAPLPAVKELDTTESVSLVYSLL